MDQNINNFIFPVTSEVSKMSSIGFDPQLELIRLTNSYNPKNENFKFNAVLYDKPNKRFIEKQEEKNLTINNDLWERAQEQNPYPKKLVPIIIKGYQQLKNRTIILSQAIKQCKLKQKELIEIVEILKNKQKYEIKKLVADLEKEQIRIGFRIFKVATQFILNSNINKEMTNHELTLVKRIQEIKTSLISRNNFLTKINFVYDSKKIAQEHESMKLKKIRVYDLTLLLKKQQYLIRELSQTILADIRRFKLVVNSLNKMYSS